MSGNKTYLPRKSPETRQDIVLRRKVATDAVSMVFDIKDFELTQEFKNHNLAFE